MAFAAALVGVVLLGGEAACVALFLVGPSLTSLLIVSVLEYYLLPLQCNKNQVQSIENLVTPIESTFLQST